MSFSFLLNRMCFDQNYCALAKEIIIILLLIIIVTIIIVIIIIVIIYIIIIIIIIIIIFIIIIIIIIVVVYDVYVWFTGHTCQILPGEEILSCSTVLLGFKQVLHLRALKVCLKARQLEVITLLQNLEMNKRWPKSWMIP